MRLLACNLSILFFISSHLAFAQIERVIVETYYISDQFDATDTFGGHLEEGSTTCRIFIDLLPNSRILSIYGDEAHPLIFASTKPFFNHREEGVSFGREINKNRYELGTLALDTYITIGQSSSPFTQGAYFGIPKNSDPDGSLVGGVHNDGGSQNINGGLLINNSPGAGANLTVSDGLTVSSNIPGSWIDIGFKDILTEEDTTIFGSSQKLLFSSSTALLQNSGVNGVDSIQNEILVAQLTTKGEISFELNIEVEVLKDGNKEIVKFVARNEMLNDNEVFSPLLNYPYLCGCTDPEYLEASTEFACTDNSKCLTPVVIGCSDSLACNYNPLVNLNLPDLCCYVGYCHDLDLSEACPDLKPRDDFEYADIKLYPNPVSSAMTIELSSISFNEIRFNILDVLGNSILEGNAEGSVIQINTTEIMPGPYLIQIRMQDKVFTIPFIKI